MPSNQPPKKNPNQSSDQSHHQAHRLPEADLTAFALGETDHLNPQAAQAVRQAYETNPTVRQQVDEIRQTAAMASRSFHTQVKQTPKLDIAQTYIQNQTSDQDDQPNRMKFPAAWWQNKGFWIPTGLAAAAGIALIFNLIPESSTSHNNPSDQIATYQPNSSSPTQEKSAGSYVDEENQSSLNPNLNTAPKQFQSNQNSTASQEPSASKTLGSLMDLSDSSSLQQLSEEDAALDMAESIAELTPAQTAASRSRHQSIAETVTSTNLLSAASSDLTPKRAETRSYATPSSASPSNQPILGESMALSKLTQTARTSQANQTNADVEPGIMDRIIKPNLLVEKAPEQYPQLVDQPFYQSSQQPLSTFSIDVDTASYTNTRRFIQSGVLPPKDAVRIEEFINAFDYDDADQNLDTHTDRLDIEQTSPFTTSIQTTTAPWNPNHLLTRISLKAIEVQAVNRPQAHLVFLIDISGSMRDANKLALVQQGLIMLTESLNPNDQVSIVTYANGTQVALPPTPASKPSLIIDTINNLTAGGSTNGAGGLELAYAQLATSHAKDKDKFKYKESQDQPPVINRIILCTDGDFNVGPSNTHELTQLVKKYANDPQGHHTQISVFGFGTGSFNDAMLESITNHGNGIYRYIPDLKEAYQQFVLGLTGQLVTVAKDVKVQVEFNPNQVAGYRLIGYANRILEAQDFNQDTVDAGDIGSGHTVTALYEIVPAGQSVPGPKGSTIDPLRYQSQPHGQMQSQSQSRSQSTFSDSHATTTYSDELAYVKIRYKAPNAPAEPGTSQLLTFPVQNHTIAWEQASSDLRFAAAVALFAQGLRQSPYIHMNLNQATTQALKIAQNTIDTQNPNEQRQQFIALLQQTLPLTIDNATTTTDTDTTDTDIHQQN